MLHSIFKHASARKWTTSNPVANVERVAVRRPAEFAVLSVEEVMAVARVAPTEQDAALITAAAFTGLRLGELRALRWRDVAWGKRYVHVRRSFTGTGEKAPKSGKARSVPLSDPVARVLDALSKRDRFTGPDDRVFCSPIGGVLDEGQIRDMFYAALEAAGIDRDRGTGKDLASTICGTRSGRWPSRNSRCRPCRRGWGTPISRRRCGTSTTVDRHGEADALSALIEGERVPAGTKLSESEVI